MWVKKQIFWNGTFKIMKHFLIHAFNVIYLLKVYDCAWATQVHTRDMDNHEDLGLKKLIRGFHDTT